MTEIASLVLFTDQLDATVAFYRALGVELDAEDHGDGNIHAAGEVGGVHMAVIAGSSPGREPGWRAGGSTFVGLWVPSLDASAAALGALGAEQLQAHQLCEWGCRIVVADPDGRAVEINQRGHCPPPAGA